MTAHDDTFRNNQEAFEIVARAWHHHNISVGRPKLPLRTIGGQHFAIESNRALNNIITRAEEYVRSAIRAATGAGACSHGQKLGERVMV